MSNMEQQKEQPAKTLQFGISFGIISPTLSEQLTKQGFKFDVKKIKAFESQREAFSVLRMSGLLTDSMADKITVKLYNNIRKHVCAVNKLKIIKK